MQKSQSSPRAPLALGIGAVVIATVASSLTAGAAWAGESRAADAQQVGPLVTETSSFADSPAFSAPSAGTVGGAVAANRARTLAEARAAATRWFIPAPGSTTNVRPVSAPGLCLTAGSTTIENSSPVTLQNCVAGAPAQQFTLAANTGSNNPIGTGLQSTYNGGFLGLYNTDSVMRLQSQTVADRIPTLDDFVGAFSADLDRVDVLTRTAYISGSGTPDATILVNGGSPVTVAKDGSWSTSVRGLDLGKNTIQVEQYEGSVKTGDVVLDADLVADALTFDATFSGNRDAPVIASGKAHPGAEVSLFDASGKQIGSTVTANPITGAWTTTIPAPNRGGGYAVTAAQFMDGVRDSAHDRTRSVEYGAAVTVTTPADGSSHAGGPLRMTGAGEPGSAIEVRDVTNGGNSLVGTSKDGVLPNKNWSLDTTDLDRAEHVLRVVQKSKGANTTVAEVTINPGETGGLAPVTLVAPTTVTPGVVNTFRGTAEPDATYEVVNVSGTPIVDGPLRVASDGTWTFDRTISWDAKQFQFRIVQTKGDQTDRSELFVIAANAGFAPVTVTNKTVLPGELNTFTGTGPADAEYEVLNASGSPLLPGKRDIDSNGKWSFDRDVSKGQLGFSFKFRITVDGSSYTTKLFTLPANTR
ncbi:hypothetical protein [Curtobacterium sp. ZW137]|uniref:hypothetical protein n=1 Tax=Curtobacterium sp. ZW137 TaxID=2485104 RepID=UPI000F919A4C|nr:hypothetical protein [Curtobacterium sp. ZW137]ROP65135.1 hypothetical protein EDF55_1789 [Curtobacterium sp. ZW137]